MDTRTRTLEGVLPLLWLASPALPVGGFSYSEGLEAAVEAGHVSDEATAAQWLAQQLHLCLARADLVVVRRVLDDAGEAAAMDAWVLQTRETSELRQQSVQMGHSMGEWMKNVHRATASGFTYPVAWALAASHLGANAGDALHAFAFGWAENMVQAAVRVVPLGQSAGQRILGTLANEIPGAVRAALGRDTPQAFSPMLAILSSRHEHQYSRLFRS